MTTIPMLEKELEQAYKDIKYYKNRIERLNNQLQQKENIIKEVREYIENNTEEKKSWLNGIPDYRVFRGDTKDLLEILDKEKENK